MAKIDTYGNDSAIEADDKLIGTDGTTGEDSGKTKNFTISALSSYIGAQALANPVVLTGILEAASDVEAAGLGVPVGGVYENSGQLYIRKY